MKKKKSLIIIIIFLLAILLFAKCSKKSTPEIITAGDVDYFGFDWKKSYDVFKGEIPPGHGYPFDPEKDDAKGTDKIFVGSGAKSSADGYAGSTNRKNKPETIKFKNKNKKIESAYLQLFLDDFQAPRTGSKFQVKLNGKREKDLEKIVNSLDLTGPRGSLVNFKIPEKYFRDIENGKFEVLIDDPTSGIGDGFAIDFARIYLNQTPKYFGKIKGKVLDKNKKPVKNIPVKVFGLKTTYTDKNGNFEFNNVPAGFAVLETKDKNKTSEIVFGKTSEVNFEIE